jgi:MFS family permease
LAHHLHLIGPAWVASLAIWKLVFMIIGAPGLLVALLFALTVREPLRRDRIGVVKVSLAPIWALLSSEWLVYTTLIAGAVLNTIAIYALVFWFPTLLSRNHGITSVHAAGLLGLFGTPAGIISCVGSGWLAAWLEKRGRADASLLVALGGVFWFSVAGIAAALAPTLVEAIIGYAVLGLATNCCAVSSLTALNRITPNELRGQISALLTLSIGLISLSVGPWATPFLSDHVFHKAIGLGMATVLAVSGVLSLIMFAIARPGYRRLVVQSDAQPSA